MVRFLLSVGEHSRRTEHRAVLLLKVGERHTGNLCCLAIAVGSLRGEILHTHVRRIEGANVSPTNSPSGDRKRVTVWPHGSCLFLTKIRWPRDSSSAVALSTLSTSNSSHACGTGISCGHESVPKQE